MSALPLIITTAGLAALVNAANTGPSAVTIATIGVSATAMAASAATTAIPAEIKRIATISGVVVANDTFHVALSDHTSDTYTLRTLGLYLDTGVLFAVYSQAGVIAEKAASASLLLNADVKLTTPLAGSIAFGASEFTNPPASEAVAGVTRYATPAEATAGASGVRAVTPVGLLAALNARFGAGAPSAFVKTLLTSASDAALRTLLGLKNAALKDEGAGQGLDADLLDGQHGAWYRDWANLLNKPGAFPPAAHSHAASDVTSGVFDVLRIPDLVLGKITGLVAALAGKSDTGHTHAAADTTSGIFDVVRIPDLAMAKIIGLVAALAGKAAAAHTHLWADITDKPAFFAPSAHSHTAADVNSGIFDVLRIPDLAMAKITGLVAALAGKAAAVHTHLWADLTDKPATFPPTGHGHTASEITDLLDAVWPAGELKLFDGDAPPAGARVLVADGSLFSRAAYPRLFAYIGTRYGVGDGVTTANRPDWRGIFFRGLDLDRGFDPARALGVLQASQNLYHGHGLPVRSNANTGEGFVEDADSSGSIRSVSTSYDGGNEARPVNQALLACITY